MFTGRLTPQCPDIQGGFRGHAAWHTTSALNRVFLTSSPHVTGLNNQVQMLVMCVRAGYTRRRVSAGIKCTQKHHVCMRAMADVCVYCVCVHACHGTHEEVRANFLLPPCVLDGWDSSRLAWYQAPLPRSHLFCSGSFVNTLSLLRDRA